MFWEFSKIGPNHSEKAKYYWQETAYIRPSPGPYRPYSQTFSSDIPTSYLLLFTMLCWLVHWSREHRRVLWRCFLIKDVLIVKVVRNNIHKPFLSCLQAPSDLSLWAYERKWILLLWHIYAVPAVCSERACEDIFFQLYYFSGIWIWVQLIRNIHRIKHEDTFWGQCTLIL